MMIAPESRLGDLALAVAGATEFPAPDHEGVVEQSPISQISDQCRGCLVRKAGLFADGVGQIAVVIPIAVEQLDEANVPFGQPPGQEAIVGERGFARLRAIHFQDFIGFLGDVHQFGDAGLHAISHFVSLDPGRDFRIADRVKLNLVQLPDAIEQLPPGRLADARRIGNK